MACPAFWELQVSDRIMMIWREQQLEATEMTSCFYTSLYAVTSSMIETTGGWGHPQQIRS